jgi:serine O-acetyltransferase
MNRKVILSVTDYEKPVFIEEVWKLLRGLAESVSAREPLMATLLEEAILKHESFAQSLSYRLATKLGGRIIQSEQWLKIFEEAFLLGNQSHVNIDLAFAASVDLMAIYERDPACDSILTAFMFFKGYKALQIYRVSHVLWNANRKELSCLMQSRSSEVFGVDIHPAARIGKGLMIDHATGLVIGETAVVGDNCSFLHGVTLGGTGKEAGDRHPKLGDNVVIGCNASILGNIQIGNDCKIGSGSVVLKSIPAGCTAVGSPARIVVSRAQSSHDLTTSTTTIVTSSTNNETVTPSLTADKFSIPKSLSAPILTTTNSNLISSSSSSSAVASYSTATTIHRVLSPFTTTLDLECNHQNTLKCRTFKSITQIPRVLIGALVIMMPMMLVGGYFVSSQYQDRI